MKLGLHEEAKADFTQALKHYEGQSTLQTSSSTNSATANIYQFKVYYNMGINYRSLGNL